MFKINKILKTVLARADEPVSFGKPVISIAIPKATVRSIPMTAQIRAVLWGAESRDIIVSIRDGAVSNSNTFR